MADELKAVRWRRFGKDRLYISTSGGARVGWHDLLTGETVVELEEHGEAFHLAVTSWTNSRPVDVSEARKDPRIQAEAADAAMPGPSIDVSSEPAGSGMGDEGESHVEGEAYVEGDVVVDSDAVMPEPEDPEGDPSGTEPVAPASWTDLIHNAAGAAARKEAVRQRQAAPVRTFMARALRIHTDERAWRVGADGEEKVAAQLVKLAKRDQRWRYLHAIPVGKKGSDIDHFVVGPGGVYTLNAKRHPGANLWIGGNTFMVNGHRQDYVRNSRFEAERAAKLLTRACGRPVHVTAVIVPVDAKSITIKTKPADVGVVNRMSLVKWLRERGSVLDPEAIELIFAAARRSTTWET